mgnify:CR=1 FL=1
MDPLSCILNSSISGSQSNFILVLSIIFLLILSAFFSACEMAFSTSNLIRMKNYATDKVRGARLALKYCENYDKTLSTILVGNNLVNIASTTIAAFIFSGLITDPTLSSVLNTVFMTLVILTFGEVLPKTLAKTNPEKLAMRFSFFMRYIMIILYPLTFLFIKLQKISTRKIKNKNNGPTITNDELESIINTMEEEGVIDKDSADLIQSALEISTKTAYDIMTHRVDVYAVDVNDDVEKVKSMYLDTNYTRLLVYKGDIDHIIGVLNLKDFFKSFINKKEIVISEIMTEPVYIVENMPVDDIIKKMQGEKKHMAVVLDELGGTSGIVALEDALETMVGEIYDEHDYGEGATLIKKENENEYYVDAEIELTDLFEFLEIENLPDSQYSSLGGFLYELAERVPEKGQKYIFHTIDEIYGKNGEYKERAVTIKFVLEIVEDRRVRKVRVFVDWAESKDQEDNNK